MILYPLVAWLPIAAWAVATGRAFAQAPDDSLIAHFGIHTRLLIAIPALVLAEPVMERVMRELRDYMLSYKLLADPEVERLRAFVAKLAAVKRGWIPTLAIVGLVVTLVFLGPPPARAHEIAWAIPDPTSMSFGAWWYYYVARTLMLLLGASAIWRIVLWGVLIVRLGRLDLRLVPNHPDRVMGLAFIGNAPLAIAPFFFAASSLVAAAWSHDVLYHGAHVKSFALPAAGLAIIALAANILPLLTYAPKLGRAKRAAMKQYGGLLASQGRQIQATYVDGRAGDGEELLDAPGIGPAADGATLYALVRDSYTVPITKTTLVFALVPIAIPLLFVVTTEIPLKEVLVTLAKTIL